ncbi:lysylphosphatidylglycerol synthase transmembrane domain-containing protein [Sphingobacterium paludis]|uniref:Uncharacterized protein (TIRG00374 family) n=1 Tax=Sphingobacterium paludis TaxID=1476465 RepID=A0A4R7DAN8_9SPHI|nr:lysylphosphatidylglycerol synthase transmembrane domain-containing protein [Sphingobacterium paludis]TDS17472.1 uncharacterized protein (TIRG00374 family) [Sphingobacterium paludis]
MDSLLRNKKWLKPLFVAAILVPLTIFILQTDFNRVWQELYKIGFRFFYLLLCTGIAYFLATFSWWICLGGERKKISLMQLFVVRQVGETVGLYNPSSVVGGDLLKDELLRPYAIARTQSASSIVVSRITIVLSQLLLFTFAAAWLVLYSANAMPLYLEQFIGLLVITLLVLKCAFFYLLHKTLKIDTDDAERSFSRRIYRQIRKLVYQSQHFYQQQPKAFWVSYFFSLLHWVVGSLEFFFILLFLGYDIQIMHGVLLDMGVIIVKSLGAFVPGQIGVEELGNKLVLGVIGIEATSIWLAVSILRRSRQLFWLLIGVICYGFAKKTTALTIV